VMDLARKRGLGMVEKDLTRYDLYTADECFLTGTGAEVIPVTKIDNRPIGKGQAGPLTWQLIGDFHELVRKEQ
jgi:branched-chain amino acid aminotransferase